MRRLARRLGSESGSALPVVVGVMLIIGILVSVIHQTSNRVAQSTTRERAEKRAFQAAEAGLHVAKYRLNKMLPLPEQCLTTVPYTPPSPSSPCPTTDPVEIGSGATYRYTVTRPLEADAAGCDMPSGLDYARYYYRCITSIGSSKSQTRRVQAVVQLPRDAGMFPVEGIFGISSLSASNNMVADGEIGSNTSVDLFQWTPPAPDIVLGPGGTVSPSSPQLTPTYLDEPFPGKVWADRFAASLNVPPNNNANWPTGPGLFTLNQFRELTTPNSAVGSATSPIPIPAGTYNFCNVQFANGVYLRPLGPVKIFIDSNARLDSGCRNNSGNFVANNEFVFKSATSDPAMIHIEMYGAEPNSPNAPPPTQFLVKNNFDFAGTLYAPRSTIQFKNSATVIGAMVGKRVLIENNFTLTGVIPEGLTAEDLVYESQGWLECVRTPSGSDPGSGC